MSSPPSRGREGERSAKVDDWVVPFPKPRDEVEDARHFRSTWLTASQTTIRERGKYDAYVAAIDPAHREAVLGAIVGTWLPIEVARAHYVACDKLGFSEDEMVEIGRKAMRRANASTLTFLTHLARGAGATPWSVMPHFPRVWAMTCDGGAMGAARLGPKEARVEIVGFPLAAVRYNRITMRGIILGAVELFCARAYAKEIPALCSPRRIGVRLSWV